jgi:hypothetical protein
LQGGHVSAVRRFHFQHHDRDDDGDDTVAEGFKAVRLHA